MASFFTEQQSLDVAEVETVALQTGTPPADMLRRPAAEVTDGGADPTRLPKSV
jgi:hypothetical protein